MNKENNNNTKFEVIDYNTEVSNDLIELNISLDTDNISEWVHHDKINYALTRDELIIKIQLHRNSNKKKSISKELITHVLLNEESTIKQNNQIKCCELIKYDASIPDKFEELARFITKENYDPMYPIILKHVVWTIKRRLFRLSDYCPIFLNVYGAAGCGKSEFLNSFLSVLPPGTKSNVSQADELFNDERQGFRFVQSFALVMDELTGLDKSDINKLKNQIDSKIVVYRMLGHNKVAEGRNNAQLIGSSNTRLKNTITSDTDIRKWAELDFYSYPDEQVRDNMVTPLQQWDWVSLWKSVNENSQSLFVDAGLYSSFKKWSSNKCKHESAHGMYIERLIETRSGDWMSKPEIYDNGYKQEVTEHALNWGNFKEKCEKMGFVAKKTMKGIGLIVPSIFESKEDNNNISTNNHSLTNSLSKLIKGL